MATENVQEPARGSAFHLKMLRAAFPPDGVQQQVRPLRPTPFHFFKMRYLMKQKSFAPRLANHALYKLEAGRAIEVHYFPPAVQMEINGTCNLHCHNCIVGNRLPSGHRMGKAELSMVKSIVDQIHERSHSLTMHFHGEPLLNQAVFVPGCEYAVEHGLWTCIHSNLSVTNRSLASHIIESRLCNLVVSCDGATKETYEKYRRGGDVDVVFENMERIAAEKKKRKSEFPWITAKFIVFDHNWQEVERYRERALRAGANDVLFVAGFAGSIYESGRPATDREFKLDKLEWETRTLPDWCSRLWEAIHLDHDAAVLPCGYAHNDEHLFVDPDEVAKTTIMQQWNCEKYKKIRAYFVDKSSRQTEGLPSPCKDCEFVCRNRSAA